MEDGNTLNFRVERPANSDEFVVTNVFVHGARITADTLRSIFPAQDEAMVNHYVAVSAQHQHRTRARVATLPAAIFGAGQDDSGLTVGELRSRRTTTGHTWNLKELDEEVDPLGRPDGTDPDAFYAQVAKAYRLADPLCQGRVGHAVVREI